MDFLGDYFRIGFRMQHSLVPLSLRSIAARASATSAVVALCDGGHSLCRRQLRREQPWASLVGSTNKRIHTKKGQRNLFEPVVVVVVVVRTRCMTKVFVDKRQRMQQIMGRHVPVDTTPGPVPVYRAPKSLPLSSELHVTSPSAGATVGAQLSSPQQHQWNSHHLLIGASTTLSTRNWELTVVRRQHLRICTTSATGTSTTIYSNRESRWSA